MLIRDYYRIETSTRAGDHCGVHHGCAPWSLDMRENVMSSKHYPMFSVAEKLIGAAQDTPPTPKRTSYRNCVHISTGELLHCFDPENDHDFWENSPQIQNHVLFMALATEQRSTSSLSFVMFTLLYVLSSISERRERDGALPSENGPPRHGPLPRLVGVKWVFGAEKISRGGLGNNDQTLGGIMCYT